MDETKMIYLGIRPYDNEIEVNRLLGMKALSEASTFYNRYISYCEYISNEEQIREASNISEEVFMTMADSMVEDLLDQSVNAIQEIVNVIYALTGKNTEATQKSMIYACNKNYELNENAGAYNDEETEEKEDENDGNEA